MKGTMIGNHSSISQIPGIDPYLYALTPEQQMQMMMYREKKSIDLIAKSADKYESHMQKVDMLDRKEEKEQRRALFNDEVISLEDGKLYYLRLNPEDFPVGMHCICHCKNLSLIEFASHKGMNTFKVYMLRFDRDVRTKDEDSADGIIISEEHLTPQKIVKFLDEVGVHIHMNAYNKENIPGLIFKLLKKSQTSETIPFSTGWNLKNGVWTWVEPTELTYMGVIDGAK